MAKIKRMDQIKAIFRCYLRTKNFKETARILNISKNTVKTYVRKALSSFDSLEHVLAQKDEDIYKVVYQNFNSETDQIRLHYFNQKYSDWVKELRKTGVTKHLLWLEYKQKNPSGYGYSQFCEHFKRKSQSKDLTISLDHRPGEVMQVDFAGKKLNYVDIETGEIINCEVLVAVMPHSQKSFAIALKSQKTVDFIEGLNQAFLFFGGLPKVLLSDNLKSYVTKSDRYYPDFNALCQQLGAHYQIDLAATRVAKPKDKASVENMVSTIYKRVYAPLRGEIFHCIEDLNCAIIPLLEKHNNTPYQKKEGCRQQIFLEYERPLMRDLPPDLFEIKKVIKAKVRKDYHVEIGEDRHFYSVHFKHVSKQAMVIYTSKSVEIFIDNQRVATHLRNQDKNKYRKTTIVDHMPNNHKQWQEAKGYKPAYFIEQAKRIGISTSWVIGQILISRIHTAQSFSSCMGILALARKYSNQRLELACQRCMISNHAGYKKIKNILEKNLDQQPQQSELFTTIDHENIRGPEAYL